MDGISGAGFDWYLVRLDDGSDDGPVRPGRVDRQGPKEIRGGDGYTAQILDLAKVKAGGWPPGLRSCRKGVEREGERAARPKPKQGGLSRQMQRRRNGGISAS